MQSCAGSLVLLALTASPRGAQVEMPSAIGSMPEGYSLQVYDDCGVENRQPHIECAGVHEYSPAVVSADEQARTVAWGWREVVATYDDLDRTLKYVVAVTYANEPFNNRAQSLWADSIQLHDARALPKGGAERLVFRIPREVTAGGKLRLAFRMEAEVNAVVSGVELWAGAASPVTVHPGPVWALYGDVHGEVLGLRYEPLPEARVVLRRAGAPEAIAVTHTDASGSYRFDRSVLDELRATDVLEVVAGHAGRQAVVTVPAAERHFEPVRYRPIAARQAGARRCEMSLDGEWRIHPQPIDDPRALSLAADGWQPFRVPGQWLQQGYDLPQDQPVAVAREFSVPGRWGGRRIFLRFDAIHAGTRYWLNGTYLGQSENLFTPVEWEITDALRFGEVNRLDLEMTVDTLSEKLSHASGYAFHNLGGIDRSAHLFALPQVHVRDLRVSVDLDEGCRDADLGLQLTIDHADDRAESELSLHVSLVAPNGAQVEHWVLHVEPGPLDTGGKQVVLATRVIDPLKWSAEKPNLYGLVLELKQGGRLIERIERNVGFRKVEVRDSQLYVNGRRVKLAGACRHEIDPLTGRANTARHAEGDVTLLKAANLNYIRTSHYPPTQELLDAADRLGMYVEVEAPFCWVGNDRNPEHLRAVLTPTSAMIDYHRGHPSVILWSLANESQFNPLFEVSAKLCKDLDPTRPTTFNNPDPKRLCDIANLHYAPMPYDQHLTDDPRPILLGEYFFPVCHEQTDVMIDPGLRELWGHGHSDPNSEWGRKCAESFQQPRLGPGTPPGTWSYMVRSDRVIGGAIWAAFDEPFYLPDGGRVGYAWHHGFWGLIDAWRRPKPEWWLSKLIHSPVWFPVRTVDFSEGVTSVRLPVENRYAFTNLNELTFTWKLGERKGRVAAEGPPASTGEIEIPLPRETTEGETVLIEVTGRKGELINVAAIQLGERPRRRLPRPRAGAPAHRDEGDRTIIEGAGFGMVLDRRTGRFEASDARHTASVLEFPSVHVTRFDFGDLAGPNAAPYEVLPKPETRILEAVTVREIGRALELRLQDRYEDFAGSVTWVIDRNGIGKVAYEYTYLGDEMSAREIGIRFLLPGRCDEVNWKRWSEWGAYPDESISRVEGRAKAHRDPKLGSGPEGTPPRWAWRLDETDLGTNDFRSVKLNVYEAGLQSPDGRGLRLHADADAHARACLDERGVRLHLLSECRLGPITLQRGDRLAGEFIVELVTG